jgi:hypothetical protein
MAQKIIDTGAVANDGTGTPLRTAFTDTNDNFTEIYTAGPVDSNIRIVDNSILTINTNGNLVLVPNGTAQVVANADIVPNQANVRNLGSTTNRWNTIYTQYLNVSTGFAFSGNTTINGNLSVTGNVAVNGKTIRLAKTAANAAQASGAGILVGANANIATFLYSSTTNSWTTAQGISTTGNVTGNYILGDGSLLTGIAAPYGNANVAAFLPTYNGNIGSLTATGNIQTVGGIFIGNGAGLTGVVATSNVGSASQFGNGTTVFNIPVADGNMIGNVSGVVNVYEFSPQGLNIRGNVSANTITANAEVVAAGEIQTDTGFSTDGYLSVTGTSNLANTTVAGTLSADTVATPNLTVNVISSDDSTIVVVQDGLEVYGDVIANGNVAGAYILGNGSQLTGLPESYSNANVVTLLSNFGSNSISTTGNVNVGNLIATGNVAGAYVLGNGSQLTGLPQQYGNANVVTLLSNFGSNSISTTGNVNAGNLNITDDVIATGNITGNYFVGNGSQLTGVSTADIGNITFADTTISAPDGAEIRIDAKDTGGVVSSSLVLRPGDTQTRLEQWSGQNSQLFTTADWTTGTYTNQGGFVGYVEFTGAANIINFINSKSGTGQIYFSVNGGPQVSSYGTGGGGTTITFFTPTLPTVDPTTVTTFEYFYNYQSGFEIDYDAQEINLYANDADINVSTTGPRDIDLNSARDLTLQGNGTTGLTNYSTSSAVTVTANASGTARQWSFTASGNLLAPGNISAVGTITGGNIATNGFVSATGNIGGGNIRTNGLVTAGGNVQAGNVRTAGLVSATGNVIGAVGIFNNGLSVTGNIIATGNLEYQSVNNLVVGDPMIYIGANNTQADLLDMGIVASANISDVYQYLGFVRDHSTGVWGLFGNQIEQPTTVVDWANVVYQPFQSGAATFAGANINGDLTGATSISAIGNITGEYFFGDGSQLTGIVASEVGVLPSLSVTGNTRTGNLLTGGIVSATGNITGGNVVTGGQVSATGNVTGGNIRTAGEITATGNITGGNLSATNLVVNTISSDDSAYVTIADGLSVHGDVDVTGNVSGEYFFGNGSQLTGLAAGTGNLDITGTVIEIAPGASETVINITPSGATGGWAYLQLPTNDTANLDNTRLHNDAGNIEFGTGDFSTGSTDYIWTLDNTGNLNLPANGDINFNGGGIKQALNEDIYIRASDDESDGWSIYNVVDDGAGNTLAQTRLEFDQYTIRTNAQGAFPYTWAFRDSGVLELPGDLYGNVGGNLTVKIGDQAGSDTFIDLQTRSYTGDALISNIRIANPNVTVSTAAGVYNWTFDSTGNLNLPPSGSLLGVTANNTGYLNWVGNSSGDGLGYTTLNLVPDTTTGDGYLIIDPTSPNHIHIRAGGTQDNSAAQLYLGGENSYFKVDNGADPNVYVGANSYVWTFGTDSVLTVPNEGTIQSINDTIILQSVDTASGNVYSARLGTNGGLYFATTAYPAGWLNIENNSGNANITAAQGTSGEAGKNLYITAGAADQTDYYTTPGGNVNITGGLGAFNDGGGGGAGGAVNISSGASADPAGHAGNVNVTAGSNNWVFAYTGTTVFPGNLTGSGASPAPSINGFNSINSVTVSATGNITSGNLSATNLVINTISSDDSAYVTVEDGLSVHGDVDVIGNIAGTYLFGNGSQLTGIAGGVHWQQIFPMEIQMSA